jgi:hypothetical protein
MLKKRPLIHFFFRKIGSAEAIINILVKGLYCKLITTQEIMFDILMQLCHLVVIQSQHNLDHF